MGAASTKQLLQDNQADSKLVGIRGWLILHAVGIIASLLAGVIYALISLWSLKEVIGAAYGPYYLLRIVVNIGILFYLFILALRFFGKRRNAPQTVIRFIIIQLVVSIFFFIVGLVVMGGDDPLFLTSLLLSNNFIVQGIAAAIWIPYFKISKRVKATFVIQEDYLPYKIVYQFGILYTNVLAGWLFCRSRFASLLLSL
jgi:hypothetical protein